MVNSKSTCPICKAGQNIVNHTVDKSLQLLICKGCGFVETNKIITTPPNTTPCPRLGSQTKSGRDFQMARMATTILGCYDLTLAVYRPGVSYDFSNITSIPMVDKVYALDNSSSTTKFAPTLPVGTRKYDVIILNETIQTLRNKKELINLLKDLKPNGILIASTDLNIGTDISASKLLASPSVCSMWSGKSLELCAIETAKLIDFRVPEIAIKKKHYRKKYVFFYNSLKVEQCIRLYFTKTHYAPSEAV